MQNQKRSYEQRKASKKLAMRVTIIVVSIAMLVGVAGTAGITALMGG